MDPFIVSLVLRDRVTGEDEETLVAFETQGDEGVAAIVKLLSKERRVLSGRAYVKVQFGVIVESGRVAVLQMEEDLSSQLQEAYEREAALA